MTSGRDGMAGHWHDVKQDNSFIRVIRGALDSLLTHTYNICTSISLATYLPTYLPYLPIQLASLHATRALFWGMGKDGKG